MSEIKAPEKASQFRLGNWFPELTADQLSKLEAFYKDLILVNKSSSLLPHKTLGSIDSVYFADCIYGSRLIYEDIPQVKEVLDLGTGIGLPGLIFAILFPQVKVIGLDADFRKCTFLKETVAKLDINNFEVAQATTEQFSRSDFEAVITRDFNTISRTLLASRKLVKSGGALYHFKGEEWSLEVSEMPSQLCSMWQPSLVGEYKLPSGGVKKEYILKTTRL